MNKIDFKVGDRIIVEDGLVDTIKLVNHASLVYPIVVEINFDRGRVICDWYHGITNARLHRNVGHDIDVCKSMIKTCYADE